MRRIGDVYSDEDSPREHHNPKDTLSDAEFAAQLQREENAKYDEYQAGKKPTVLNLSRGAGVNTLFSGHTNHPIASYATSLLPTIPKHPEKTYQTAYGYLTDEELARKLAEEPDMRTNNQRRTHDQFFDEIPELSHQPMAQQKRSHTPYYMASHDVGKLHILDLSSNVNPRNTPELKLNESELIIGNLDPSHNNDLENIIKIWKTTSSTNLVDKILALLKDYTGDNSRVARFFSGKLNRSHIDVIVKISNAIDNIKKLENNFNDFTNTICQWILKCLMEIPLNNPKGTLATIIQIVILNVPKLPVAETKLPPDIKIPEKYFCQLSQDIYVDPVTDEFNITHENSMIQEWRKNKNTCPFDRRPYAAPAKQEFPKDYQLQLEVEIFKAKCLKVDNKSLLRL